MSDEFFVLEAQPADTGSTYLPIPGVCSFEGEEITEVELPSQVEPTLGGYTRYPRLCSAAGTNSVLNTISGTIPSACGLECDDQIGCIGFVYYPNYGSGINAGSVGDCKLLNNLEYERCSPTVQTDYYLPGRGDTDSTCHAMCNIHRQCSYYKWDSQGGCILYSDMNIKQMCGSNSASNGEVIHIGLKYALNRDPFIEVDGQCPTSNETHSISNVSFHQCKKACLNVTKCRAITYDTNGCGLYNFSSYDDCPTSTPSPPPLYIESIEHTYQEPLVNFLGDTVLLNTTATLTGCKRLCDTGKYLSALVIPRFYHFFAFPIQLLILIVGIRHAVAVDGCHSIFLEDKEIDNCQIRGGGAISNSDPIWNSGQILVASDVALFTQARDLPVPASTSLLATFSNVFSLDECKTLCDARDSCDSLHYASSASTCDLYPFDPSAARHFHL